jgi:succinate dehydrogenase flavin-adding protein (antitoxin of CptAB toxin-antitoxin module)
MKTVILLFVIINLFSCNIGSLDYKAKSESDKFASSPTPSEVVCLEENYKPKSKDSIESMTPRQLIDESVKVKPDSFETYSEVADYETFIEKNIRKAGVEALPVLTEYMNAYEPKSASYCEGFRFSTVRRLAHDLDRFEFRLRGTKEGRLAISAFERGIERTEMPGVNKGLKENRTIFLSELKGVNEVDRSILNTFLVRKSFEISESELLDFSNFLVERDPTYPSWSDTDFIKDYSRINEAGNPAQVYVLKKPERYYEAYLEFKKTKR